jgi:hypothetical protein
MWVEQEWITHEPILVVACAQTSSRPIFSLFGPALPSLNDSAIAIGYINGQMLVFIKVETHFVMAV